MLICFIIPWKLCQIGYGFDEVTFSNPFLAKVITRAIDMHISRAYNKNQKNNSLRASNMDAMMQSLDLVASPQLYWGKDFEEQVANPANWPGSLFYREIVQT